MRYVLDMSYIPNTIFFSMKVRYVLCRSKVNVKTVSPKSIAHFLAQDFNHVLCVISCVSFPVGAVLLFTPY